jgi:hypothetical protein
MKRLVLPLSALLLALTGPTAHAQPGRAPATPLGQPVLSPYLNLAQPGFNPAISYFGVVRPQLQTQGNIQQLQQFQATQTYLDNTALVAQPILNTGTSTGFMTYNRYFQTVGRGGTATAAVGAPLTPAPPPFNNFVLPGQFIGTGLR